VHEPWRSEQDSNLHPDQLYSLLSSRLWNPRR